MAKIEATFFVDENGRFTAEVTNKFDKQKSWLISRKSSILSHEQGHFDISEIYARKIRREIIELLDKGEKDDDVYSVKVKQFLSELSAYQETYDSETHHGFLLDKQFVWEKGIQKELDHLKRFRCSKLNYSKE